MMMVGIYHDAYAEMKGKGNNNKKVSSSLLQTSMESMAWLCGPSRWCPMLFPTSHDDAGFHMFPVELFSTNENASTQSSIPPGHGMLDCGATASAGPKASAKKLISFLLHCDPNLQVSFNCQKRPYFQYGSGNGVVLCIMRFSILVGILHDVLSSMCWTILQNMVKTGSRMIYWFPFWWDYLKKTGLILDFSDGDTVNGHDVNPEPYTMEKNAKGHFMVNIAHYLFGNLSVPRPVTQLRLRKEP